MAYKDGSKSGGRRKVTPNRTTAAVRELAGNFTAEPVEYVFTWDGGDGHA